MSDKQTDEPQARGGNKNSAAFPVRKTASFVSRSISSGKRRTYDVAVTNHGADNVTMEINGATTHLSAEGLTALCGLLNDASGDANKPIHHGVSRKGVSGDPEFDPSEIAESDENGLNARTEGQNDEVNGVEAKIRSEARSLQIADGLDLSLVADADAKAVKLAEDQASKLEDQQKQTGAEVKTRETEANKTNKK